MAHMLEYMYFSLYIELFLLLLLFFFFFFVILSFLIQEKINKYT